MSDSTATCWTVIQGAAAGVRKDREEFARRYAPVVRAYLGARWRGTPLFSEIDDATQEVFLDCFQEDGGALGRAEPGRPGGFRAFFFGVIRNVAMRAERNRARRRVHPADLDADRLPAEQEGLATVFDRAWGTSILLEAGRRQAEWARGQGERAERRVALLRLRFRDGLPIREIAKRWEVDAARLHHEYGKARDEFQRALEEVVAFHHPGTPGEVAREAARLLDLFR